jgi:serine/threonine protein kinase
VNAEAFAAVERVFHAVLRLDPAAREGYIDQELKEPELRQEVYRLLSATDQTSTFLDVPLLDDAGSSSGGPGESVADRTIGPYRLIRELGRGGMGIVYEAEQAWPRRRVALKIVHGGGVGENHQHFWHEARVLGRLNHPSLAAIYGADQTPDGVAYFVMELIQGERLDQYVTKYKLGLREQLKLFCRICDAIQYAHMKSVIHLDLKPSNILVIPPIARGDEPQVKVVDFGIAAVTGSETTLPTRLGGTGALPGTLAYMSPEQRRGERDAIDVRTDTYALGVVLFKLTTGTLPYPIENVTFAQAWRILANEQPRRPRLLNKSLPPDIETIIQTAIAEEPARRYQSVAELAGDVRRYLADLPITARRPSTLYEWSKFARRNKGLVATLAAALLGLTATTIGTGYGLHKALMAEGKWRQEAAFNQYLIDMLLVEFAPDSSAETASRTDPQERRRALEIKRDAARAKVQAQDYAGADAEYTRLVEIARRLFPPDAPGAWYVPQLLGEHGECLMEMRRFADAEQRLLESHELALRQFGDDHPMTIAAVRRLVSLYMDWGKPAKASEWGDRMVKTSDTTSATTEPTADANTPATTPGRSIQRVFPGGRLAPLGSQPATSSAPAR